MFPTGNILSPRQSKHQSKRSISHKEIDTPFLCVSPSHTKQEKMVPSMLSKQSDIKHNKSAVKDSADLSSSVSKLPTRGQRSSNKANSKNSSPPEDSPNTKQVKDSDRFKFKSLSTEQEDNQSSISEIKLKEKSTRDEELQMSITSPTTEEMSKIQPVQNNNAIITEDTKAKVTPGTGPGTKVFPRSEVVKASPSQLPVTDVYKSEAGSQGGQCESKQQTKVESPPEDVPHIQRDNTTQEQETPSICPEDVKEKDILETTQLISNIKLDLIQEKSFAEPNSAVLAQDSIPAHEDKTDMSAKPVLVDSIQGEITTYSNQDSVIPGTVSLKKTKKVTSNEYDTRNSLPVNLASRDQDAEPNDVPLSTSVDSNLTSKEQQNDLLKDQTTNVIHENDGSPPFSRNLVKDFEVEEESKEGKKVEALDIQTETVTVFDLPKNVVHQLHKEPLLLAQEIERLEKDSKPNERLDDAVVEITDLQNSCKKELKGITVEDDAEKDITKPEKTTHLLSEEQCSQPDTEKDPQMVRTDALEEKNTETEQARSALHENTASVVNTQQEWAMLSKENAESVNKETGQQIAAPTVKNEQKPVDLLTKNEEVRDNESHQEDNHTDVAKERQTPELKALSIKTQRSEGTNEKSDTRAFDKNFPNEFSNEAADTEVSRHKDQNTSIARDQDEDIKKTEENACISAQSECPNANLEQQTETEKAPEKTTESQLLQRDVARELNETQSTEGAKGETETMDLSVKGLVNETAIVSANREVCIQQDQKSTIGRHQDEGITNPKKIKSKKSKCLNTNLEQEPRTKAKESLKMKEDKTDSCLKKGLQTLREEKIINLGDPQKPAKQTHNNSSLLSAAVKPSTPSQSLQLKKESPSSWLNVEHHQKQKKEYKRRVDASASEDESLEPDDFDDFIRSIKEGSIPFSLPPKRHIHKKSPSPSFAMPAIKEDHFERTFDPEEFQFGLRKNGKCFRDPSPAMVLKQKAAKREGRTMEKRAQDNAIYIAEDQMKSLDEVEGQDGVKEGTNNDAGKEEPHNNGEGPGKPMSRLGRISILSSLLSSPRSKRTKEDSSSASNSTLSSHGTDEGPLMGDGTGIVSESSLSQSSPPPLPLLPLSEAKLPDHLEKYLKRNKRESEADQSSEQMTKNKLNHNGSAVRDQALIAGATNVGLKELVGLPPTNHDSQQTSQNGLSTSKTRVGISIL